jgi:alpha-amylase
MQKINFLMGLHCHQPVDNFKTIFKEAWERSYDPFLRVLAKHPKIKLSLHYSGSLLDWFVKNRPDFIARIRALIEKGQIEILTGGHFEPILSMIPTEDAKGQIGMLTRSIKKHFNYTPSGAWLAERVWSPALAGVFNDLNIKYTILDDFHLKQAGVSEGCVFGRYLTKDFDDFSVFASVKKLRYTIPFGEVETTMDFLKGLRENPDARTVTFADDCEKFGFWPYTYDWVYKKGWLEKFFTALEENDWIRTLTFREALLECEPSGKLEIPESSYAEMIEWCNGNFNNFFKKYPESNLMRNRMLFVSEKIGESRSEQAKEELYKAQSNCAYWHGVFGGIYTSYLRHGIYSHIIKAESILEDKEKEDRIDIIKFKDGGQNIIRAQNRHLALFVNPDRAGSLFEIDYKPLSYNLGDTMSRCYEPYHEKLKGKQKRDLGTLKKNLDEGGSVDLYEVLGVRERNLKRFLNYDSYQKFSCICHAMDPRVSLEDFIKSRHVKPGEEALLGPHTYKLRNENGKLTIELERICGLSRLRLNKCVMLERGPEIFLRFDLENLSSEPVNFMFGMEFNWPLEDKNFMRPKSKKGIKNIALRDKFSRIKVSHFFKTPVNLWSFPVYTLNESEKGLGKSFQQISILFHKKLALEGGAGFSLDAAVRVSE